MPHLPPPRALACAALLLTLLAACSEPRGLRVGVENADSLALDSVVVRVGSRAYPLGRIGPGKERSVRVETADTSTPVIEHGRPARTRLSIGTRMAPGQNLTVVARVVRDSVVHVTNYYGH